MHQTKKVAELICSSGAAHNYNKWISEEVYEIATKVPNLDNIPTKAIVLLAKLVLNGESDANILSFYLDLDITEVHCHLDALCEFEFAEESMKSYKSTSTGEWAIETLGKKLIDRELFQVKARLQQLEQLRHALAST